MSQHRGGPWARQHTADRRGRPDLGRPSLFAGMDDEVVSTFGDDSASGVRILTTLESSRRKRTAPIKIEGLPVKRNVWQMRALIGLMSLGVLSLLAGFVMVLMDGRSPGGKANSEEPTVQASRAPIAAPPADSGKAPAPAMPQPAGDNPLAALIAPPQHAGIAPPPAQTAVIENVIATPPEPRPAVAPVAAAPQPLPVRPIQTEAQTEPPQVAKTTSQPKAAPTRVAMATPAQTTSSTAAAPAPAAKRHTRQDDDVALLEAMFAHTRGRAAAPAGTTAPAAGPAPATSVADELKRCATLGGASTATCRARVCVQNPTAAACHQDP